MDQMRAIGEIEAENAPNLASVTLADRGVVSLTTHVVFKGLYCTIYITLHRGLPSGACSWCTYIQGVEEASVRH